MILHLCISVTFLDGLFHGKGDGDEAEWPPSPMRLFQALLAGSRTGCQNGAWSDAKAAAFRWLERCDPPVIITPEAEVSLAYTLYVPNNDGDKEFDRQERLTSKVARPHRLRDGDTVHYVWRIDKGEREIESHVDVLCREARHLLALGLGIDQVVGNGRVLNEAEVAALPGRAWRAWRVHRPGTQRSRVPIGESLADLERVHQSFLGRVDGNQFRPVLKLSQFDAVTYLSAGTLPPRPYAAFELPEGRAFRQEGTAKIAAMLRSLASRLAREDTHKFPGGAEVYVAGHTGNGESTPPRFSYLPLPTIGHEHADGMIRRLLIAEPIGGDGLHSRWAEARLLNATLRDQDGYERGFLLEPWRLGSAVTLGRYVGQGRAWCTVTPVILPGLDDGKYSKAEKLFFKAVRQAGLQLGAVAELTMRKAPFWPGSQHPRSYFVPAYLRTLARWHVRVVFHEPVPGPLAIGAGRHVGLGVFALTEESRG